MYFLLVAAAQPAEKAAHLVLAQPRALQPAQRTLRGQHLHTNEQGSTQGQHLHKVNMRSTVTQNIKKGLTSAQSGQSQEVNTSRQYG